ncbi:MAG: hypothetical protein V2I24_16705, partial [Halieaceae bacterium]|nr:hypothetical protein [Halieaceae bacterium]
LDPAQLPPSLNATASSGKVRYREKQRGARRKTACFFFGSVKPPYRSQHRSQSIGRSFKSARTHYPIDFYVFSVVLAHRIMG